MDRAEQIRSFLKGITEQATENQRAAVCRAALWLWEKQTVLEQATVHTKYTNAVGFNKPDGSNHKLAGIINWGKAKGTFSPKQAVYVAKRLVKYSHQLATMPQHN